MASPLFPWIGLPRPSIPLEINLRQFTFQNAPPPGFDNPGFDGASPHCRTESTSPTQTPGLPLSCTPSDRYLHEYDGLSTSISLTGVQATGILRALSHITLAVSERCETLGCRYTRAEIDAEMGVRQKWPYTAACPNSAGRSGVQKARLFEGRAEPSCRHRSLHGKVGTFSENWSAKSLTLEGFSCIMEARSEG